jgi:hypothetical protein
LLLVIGSGVIGTLLASYCLYLAPIKHDRQVAAQAIAGHRDVDLMREPPLGFVLHWMAGAGSDHVRKTVPSRRPREDAQGLGDRGRRAALQIAGTKRPVLHAAQVIRAMVSGREARKLLCYAQLRIPAINSCYTGTDGYVSGSSLMKSGTASPAADHTAVPKPEMALATLGSPDRRVQSDRTC